MFSKVAGIIAGFQGIAVDKISMDSHLIKDLSFNSIMVVELVCEFEEYFGMEIPDAHISHFKTVSDIVEYLEKRVVERQ